MTPKEKAEELLKKMLSKNPNIQDGISQIDTIQAKQCALIAVDFHLKEFEDWANITCCGESFSWKYWQEVKQEIEKI